ncbi:MAG: Gfo/Idh/MocA family oxidoreductase [Verrucomicrobiales bacterium]|nr:Gfo/Idh/MocA family oxidoreductase [Verrucomicrobiales bacterium]
MSKIGIGLVGAGWMGATLLKRITERDDTVVVSLFQRNKERAEEVLTSLDLSPDLFEDDFDAFLKTEGLDAVFICSTNDAHGEQSIAAQKAGKHVFCEKPCSIKFDEFVEQIELERANPKLITMVDYLMNFDTLEKEIQEMARRGDFGTITQIQLNYRHPINIAGDKVWKLAGDRMGDAIGMGIIHSLSAMMNIMEAQGAKPIRVYASSSKVHKRDFEIPAVWNLHIEFDNGATGLCFGNVDQANGYDAYHNIHGTDGGLIFDSYLDRPQKIRFWSNITTDGNWVYPLDPERCRRDGLDAHIWPEDTTTPDSGDVMNHQTHHCVAHFIESIHSGEQSFLSFANSASVAEVGWAAQMSAELKMPIDLPLDYGKGAEFFNS